MDLIMQEEEYWYHEIGHWLNLFHPWVGWWIQLVW